MNDEYYDVTSSPSSESDLPASESSVSSPEPGEAASAPVVEVISAEDFMETMREAFMAGLSTSADVDPVDDNETVDPVLEESSSEDVAVDQTVELLTEIRDSLPADHPLLTTNFSDYTVAEGLLLAVLLCFVGSWCIKMIKGAFSWLLW